MITLDPPNYVPTDAEVKTARMVLEFARQDVINALTGASGRAQLEGLSDIDHLIYMTVGDLNRSMEWSDELILYAVKRYDSRVGGRN